MIKNISKIENSFLAPKSRIVKPDLYNKEEIKTLFNITENDAIKYIGQTGTCGYACAAKGYIADYILRGIPIKWIPLKFDNSLNDKTYYVDLLAESAIQTNYNTFNKVILHSTPDIWGRMLNENKKIPNISGFCTWETNKLPSKWVEYINLLPEVMVPSNFNKECFINSGVKSNIKVVPHIWHCQKLINKDGISLKDYNESIIPKDKFTFYSIGEFNFRKGIEDLITVFDIFNDKYMDTQLILKIHYKEYQSNNKNYCIEKIKSLTNKLGTKIFLILENLSNKEMLALHSFGDCYVSLNKGEGFGLTIFDAFNLGKNVITTGYGGQIDFLGKDYKGLVKYKINKVSGMESFSTNYSSDQEWAYPDLDCAFDLMEKIYENQL